ncbi:MAG: hypothetical protein SGJ19_05380 [Planctomycetia bacterium]|nr:hypothetical protein [Planctomycetia bacterium]
MLRTAICATLAVAGLSLCADECFAQRNNAYRRTQNSLYNRPTVSPYLNLLQPQGGGLPNYQTLVRPAVEQRRQNQDTQRQISQLQSSVAASSAQDQRGETTFRPTGHQTSFSPAYGNRTGFFYSHYYPTLNGRR